MRIIRAIAMGTLVLVVLAALGADRIAPHPYAAQFRDHANEPPSRAFLLGTDELGRDRFARLVVAARVSLACAPVAAALTLALAAFLGLLSGYFGGWLDAAAGTMTDLFLSLPWLFALLTLRAILPLNTSPAVSIAVTFLLMAFLGWASGARVVRAAAIRVRHAGPILHAKAYGCGGARLLWVHVLPNLRPVMAAQFWIAVPVFLLTEANLGILGLGVAEPLPSLGNMLAELLNYEKIAESPWILAPAILLVLIVGSLHIVISGRETWE